MTKTRRALFHTAFRAFNRSIRFAGRVRKAAEHFLNRAPAANTLHNQRGDA